jgi:hypothetical protein
MNLNLRWVPAIVLTVALGGLVRTSAPAHGQAPPSVQAIPNELVFDSIRRVAEKYPPAQDPSLYFRKWGGGKVDLYSCSGGDSDILHDSDPYYDVTDLAIWLSALTRRTKSEGTYEIAAPYLNRLVKYGDAEAMRINPKSRRSDSWKDDNDALLTSLAQALNRAKHGSRYMVDGGCGAGEIRVMVKIPAGSAAVLINTFHFALCQARGMDPWNAQVCYGWKSVGKVPLLLAGAYRYVITMTNGSKKIGDVLVAEKMVENPLSLGDDKPYLLNLQ